jgi:hypothetical protein
MSMHQRQLIRRTVTFLGSFITLTSLASCSDQPTAPPHGGRALRDCETEIDCGGGDPSNPYDSTLNYAIGVQGSLGNGEGGDKVAESQIGAYWAGLAGAGWVRISIGWDEMQPDGPGSLSAHQLERYDPAIKEFNNRGIQVLVTLTGAPYWAQLCDANGVRQAESQPGYDHCPAPGSAAPDAAMFEWFRTYVAMLADHFDGNGGRGRVNYWEVYNEPDYAGNYIIPGNVISKETSYKYAVQFAADALHPRGRYVVAGAVGSEPWLLDAVIRDVGSSVDVASIHHYGDGLGASNLVNWYLTYTHLHNSSHPIWLTEIGDANKSSNDHDQSVVIRRELTELLHANQTGGRWTKAFVFALDIRPQAGDHMGEYISGQDESLTLIKWMYSSQQTIRPAFFCMQAIAWWRSTVPSYCY